MVRHLPLFFSGFLSLLISCSPTKEPGKEPQSEAPNKASKSDPLPEESSKKQESAKVKASPEEILQALNTPNLPSGLYLNRFDRTARPQDDLYRFVNGGWLDQFKLPPEKSRYGVFNDLHERAREQLKSIILELSQQADASAEAAQIRDTYQAFMDQEAIKLAGHSPLMAQLKAFDRIKTSKELMKHFGRTWVLGISGPIRGWIDQDAKQPDQYRLYLSQGGIGLPDRDYFLKDEEKLKAVRDAYLIYLEGLFTLAGESNPKKQAKAVFDLEIQLAQIQWSRAESRDRSKTYHRLTRKELKKRWALPWDAFFEGLEAQPQSVIVRQPSFFKELTKMLKAKNLPAWRSYLKARLLSDRAPYLSAQWEELHFKFYGVTVSGKEANEPRWKRAIDLIESILGEALGKVYVARHFKPEAKARMKTLVEHLLVAFKASINELEWMSPQTKKMAQEKLKRFSVKIGYPDQWKDYSALQIDPKSLIKTIENASRFEHKREMAKLGKAIDRKEWFMPPQMVNAYYNPSMNEIVFPAAILQPPFFNLDADDAVNYGGIGAVIGHEISHGFDDQGRKSDGEGRLQDWWTAEDAERFQERASRLASHYESYEPIKGMKINGALTLGENIGDLGGLTIAYQAYLSSLNGKEAPILDGFSGSQRVFISWAQVWACQYREEELRRRLLTDSHSPAHYRVRGIIRQLDAFYEAFEVKDSDRLFLPKSDRVKIW